MKAYGFSVLELFPEFKTNWWKKNKQNSESNGWDEVSSFCLIIKNFIYYWRIKSCLCARFIKKLEKDHKWDSCLFKLLLVEFILKFQSQGLTLKLPEITEHVTSLWVKITTQEKKKKFFFFVKARNVQEIFTYLSKRLLKR